MTHGDDCNGKVSGRPSATLARLKPTGLHGTRGGSGCRLYAPLRTGETVRIMLELLRKQAPLVLLDARMC